MAPDSEQDTPPPPGAIFRLIPLVMADIGAVGKDRTNTFHHYQFRGIDDVYNAVQPALVKHGVFCAPRCIEKDVTDTQTKKGEPQIHAVLLVEHRFFAGSDGSSVAVVTVGEAMDTSDKACNKAMSAAYKYALFQLFCIPTEGDNDSENHSPEVGAPIQRAPSRPPEINPIIFDELKALAQRDCLPGYQFTEADYWAMRTPLANAVRLAHPDSPLTDELAQAWLREGGALRMGEDGNGVPTTPMLITKAAAAAPEAE